MVDQDKKMKALTGAADKAATELSYINTNINTLYSNNTNMIYTMQLAKAKKSRDDLSEELKLGAHRLAIPREGHAKGINHEHIIVFRARQAAASTGTMRGEAGLPRRVTPIGGPGTRVSAYRQADTKAFMIFGTRVK